MEEIMFADMLDHYIVKLREAGQMVGSVRRETAAMADLAGDAVRGNGGEVLRDSILECGAMEKEAETCVEDAVMELSAVRSIVIA